MSKGTFRAYIEPNFRKSTLAMIAQVNEIITEYEAQGFSLTVRQLHYQFVSRDLYENTIENYNRLGRVVSEGRMAGLISWTAIEDRGRNLMGLSHHKSPGEAIKEVRDNYRRDLWHDQQNVCEVWIEKQALEGVIGTICDELRVNFFATKGYNSQSEQWRAGRRFAQYYQRGQRPIVIHLGDHDPAGIDMTRDNRERLSLFAGVDVQVIRIALNMEQIEQYKPPPNFAKEGDSKTDGYKRTFKQAFEEGGYQPDACWELDALDPKIIQDLIDDCVSKFRDDAIWEKSLAKEVEDKNEMDIIIEGLQ